MKKVISTEKSTSSNRTIFTGNRSKWYGLYIRHYPGCTGDRRDSGGSVAQAKQALTNLSNLLEAAGTNIGQLS